MSQARQSDAISTTINLIDLTNNIVLKLIKGFFFGASQRASHRIAPKFLYRPIKARKYRTIGPRLSIFAYEGAAIESKHETVTQID